MASSIDCSGRGSESASMISNFVFFLSRSRSDRFTSRSMSTSGLSLTRKPPTSSRLMPVVSIFWGVGSLTCTSTAPASDGTTAAAVMTQPTTISRSTASPVGGFHVVLKPVVVLPDALFLRGKRDGLLVGLARGVELPETFARHREIAPGPGVARIRLHRLLEAERGLVPGSFQSHLHAELELLGG